MTQVDIERIKTIWVNLCRFVLSVVFMFSGLVKAVDPLGTAYKMGDYLAAMGVDSLGYSSWLTFCASALSIVEFCVGAYLLMGVRRRLSGMIIFILMLVMTPLTLWVYVANPVSDCGCFGDAVRLTNAQTFYKNLILLAASSFVFAWGRRIYSFVSREVNWMVCLHIFIYIFVITLISARSLPLLDFRPYHIGADIKAQMTIPEGKLPPKYETLFTLEKDGTRREFTLEDYPDDSWNFVSSRLVKVRDGYEPPISDFSLVSYDDGEDLTDKILSRPGYTILMVAHRIENADQGRIDLINELYDYCQENGYAFYALTSSPDEDIDEWREVTSASYPFCLGDDIMLKTIIRANPGFILLKDGVIMRKWAVGDLPDEYQLTDRLENLEIGRQAPGERMVKIKILLWFVVPLGIIELWGFRKKKKQANKD